MHFRKGLTDGIPIALGYMAVAFGLGIAMKNAGMNPLEGFIFSAVNLASAGEYACLQVIAADASYPEIAAVTLVANARYLLMSWAMSQRMDPAAPMRHRLGMGYFITDEIFAVTISRPGYLSPWYMYGAGAVAAAWKDAA